MVVHKYGRSRKGKEELKESYGTCYFDVPKEVKEEVKRIKKFIHIKFRWWYPFPAPAYLVEDLLEGRAKLLPIVLNKDAALLRKGELLKDKFIKEEAPEEFWQEAFDRNGNPILKNIPSVIYSDMETTTFRLKPPFRELPAKAYPYFQNTLFLLRLWEERKEGIPEEYQHLFLPDQKGQRLIDKLLMEAALILDLPEIRALSHDQLRVPLPLFEHGESLKGVYEPAISYFINRISLSTNNIRRVREKGYLLVTLLLSPLVIPPVCLMRDAAARIKRKTLAHLDRFLEMSFASKTYLLPAFDVSLLNEEVSKVPKKDRDKTPQDS